MISSSIYIFVVFIKYEKSRDENGLEAESGGSSPPGGAGPLLATPPCGETTPELISILVSSCDFVSMFNFHLYNPPDCLRSVYRVLVVFSICFCQGIVLSFRGIMASASNDKEKMPPEDDHQDLQLKEEVESEAEEEEMEVDQSSRPSTMIASIGVVTSHDKFKKSAHIRTGGGVPRRSLAPRTSSSGNNPFHTLIHEHQFQRVPKAKLPSSWDIDRSNHAEKESSKSEEG
jgi:hypothetical protein